MATETDWWGRASSLADSAFNAAGSAYAKKAEVDAAAKARAAEQLAYRASIDKTVNTNTGTFSISTINPLYLGGAAVLAVILLFLMKK